MLPLEHLFETIVGGDETKRHKPDPEPLLLAAERMRADPAECAYVGDSPFDIRDMWAWLRKPEDHTGLRADGGGDEPESALRPHFGEDLVVT